MMDRNPYLPEPDQLTPDGRATMALAYEQHMRNKIAYLTLTNRSWYDGDEELDDYFGE